LKELLKIFLCSLFLISFASKLSALDQSKIDSLEIVLQNAKEDTNKINILNEMSNQYVLSHAEKMREYAKQALSLSKELSFEKGIAESLMNIGWGYFSESYDEKAMEYFLQSLKIAEELEYKEIISEDLRSIGILYASKSHYSKAMNYCKQALEIAEESENKKGIGKCLRIIGWIYFSQKKYTKALESLVKALPLTREFEGEIGTGHCLNIIGDVYMGLNNYDKAMKYFLNALEIFEEIADKNGIMECLKSIGNLHFHKGDYEKALKYSERSLTLTRETGDKGSIQYAYGFLAKIYVKQNNYQKAYEYLNLYSQLKDSLSDGGKITELETKYKQEKELAILKKEQELKDYKQNVIKYVSFGIIFFLVLMSFVLYNRYRLKQRTNQQLAAKNIIIEDKNKDITDSIRYAESIQQAILHPMDQVSDILPDSFVLFKPKDIVSGDFYWVSKVNQYVLFSVIDCTGHGVPGAFMSMIGNDLLNIIVNEKHITTSGMVLDALDKRLQEAINPGGTDQGIKDGMDMAFCVLDTKNNELQCGGV